MQNICRNGILFPILFLPTMRKKGSRDREKLLKFEADGWEFATFLRSLEHFFSVKGQYIHTIFETDCFFDNDPGSSSDIIACLCSAGQYKDWFT